ncbi:MAG: DUF393 domain-containing protein [Phycisphaerales bacterium]
MAPSFTILIDGKCSLCRREARFMNRLDAGRGVLGIVDITAPDFEPSRFGSTMDALMGQIHGVESDGRVLTGLAVFRRAYGELAAAGGVRARLMSALVGLTAWPLLRPLSDAAYRAFARHRLRISALAGKVLGDEPPVCEGDRCRTR